MEWRLQFLTKIEETFHSVPFYSMSKEFVACSDSVSLSFNRVHYDLKLLLFNPHLHSFYWSEYLWHLCLIWGCAQFEVNCWHVLSLVHTRFNGRYWLHFRFMSLAHKLICFETFAVPVFTFINYIFAFEVFPKQR